MTSVASLGLLGSGATGGAFSGSAGAGSVGSGGGRVIVGSPERSWAGAADMRTRRTRDHRSIFADQHEDGVAAE
jgi:hypothetical protein